MDEHRRPPARYSDPSGAGDQRWWDGDSWTSHVSAQALDETKRRGSASESFVGEIHLMPWARRATICFALVGIAAGFVDLACSAGWAAYFHSLRSAVDVAPNRVSTPMVTVPPLWGYLLLPFVAATESLFLVWQHRCATTARRLAFPARHHPGLGVASYYIPVVQLWFPYQALRDCLPPGHDTRPLVLRVWLLFVACAALDLSLAFALAELRPLGWALLVANLVLQPVLGISSHKLVGSITTAHQDALSSASPGNPITVS